MSQNSNAALEGKKKWWESTSFFISLAILIGGLWNNFPSNEAQIAVQYIIALVATGGTLRTFFKTAKLDVVSWLQNSNTWQGLAVILTTWIPSLTPELFSGIEATVKAILSQNWQSIVSALFALATIIYNILKNRPKK
jgi:hypothetical protein